MREQPFRNSPHFGFSMTNQRFNRVFVGLVAALSLSAGGAFADAAKNNVAKSNVAKNDTAKNDATKSEAAMAARLVSAHRAASGLPPVRVDVTLNRAAALQSQAMAAQGVMSHEVGGAFPDRMRATGVRSPAAENIGMGYVSLEHAFSGWRDSHGHNVNMLNPEMTRIGLARATGRDGRLYWTMVLSGR